MELLLRGPERERRECEGCSLKGKREGVGEVWMNVDDEIGMRKEEC